MNFNNMIKDSFTIDGREIHVQVQKGNWGKFKHWIGKTWLGRTFTNLGAIQIKGEKEKFLDKRSLVGRISEYILCCNLKGEKPSNGVIDKLKCNKSIGKKIIKYMCEGGETNGIDIQHAKSLLTILSTCIKDRKEDISSITVDESIKEVKNILKKAITEKKVQQQTEEKLEIWRKMEDVKVEEAKELIRSSIKGAKPYPLQLEINEKNITKIQKSLVDHKKLQIGDSKISNKIVVQLFEKIGKNALFYVEELDFEGCEELLKGDKDMNSFLSTLDDYCPSVKRINLQNCEFNRNKIETVIYEVSQLHTKGTDKFKLLDDLDLTKNESYSLSDFINKKINESWPDPNNRLKPKYDKV